ncbi:hypothetical protein FACS1894102_3350 [Spirochaetia bacterium]|nr:hypothetical protein FACS1894102_3350 [Spirochaetia bacterium]
MFNDCLIISIGRENCDINIPNSKVSRHHADIKIVTNNGRTVYLFNDHSSNGTAINGRRVHNASTEIFPQNQGDIYLAGSVELDWKTIEAALGKKGLDNNATQIASGYTAPVQTTQKIRHGFTTFWLILLIAYYALIEIFAMASSEVDFDEFTILGVLTMIAGSSFLLNWKKIGVWFFVGQLQGMAGSDTHAYSATNSGRRLFKCHRHHRNNRS